MRLCPVLWSPKMKENDQSWLSDSICEILGVKQHSGVCPARMPPLPSFMQRLTLLLFLPSEHSQSTKVPSDAWSGSKKYCSGESPAPSPCWRTIDYGWRGGAAPARSVQ